MKRVQKLGILAVAGVIAVAMVFWKSVGAPEKKAPPAQATAPAPAPAAAKKAPPPPLAPRATEWTAVKQWQGTGNQDTGIFAVASGEWRIDYATYAAKGSSDAFRIHVHREDSGRMVALAADVRGEGKDTAYVRTGPGRFYLKMIATAGWTVGVEDRR